MKCSSVRYFAVTTRLLSTAAGAGRPRPILAFDK